MSKIILRSSLTGVVRSLGLKVAPQDLNGNAVLVSLGVLAEMMVKLIVGQIFEFLLFM